MSSLYRNLAILMAVITVLIAIYYVGYNKGKNSAEKAYLTLQLKTLEQITAEHKQLTLIAYELNSSLERLASTQAEENIQTTKEIRNVLKRTAATRTSCVLPNDIMQQLEAARNKARVATTTRNLNNMLPSTQRTQ